MENVYHLRLMTLLQELLRDKGHKGAARVLEDRPEDADLETARAGVLTRRVRQALERALPGRASARPQPGSGSATTCWRSGS